MKPLKNAGFTIVETMLFLGITGLLVMGVLVGTGTSINVQRYRDSVTSLKSYLQQQYSKTANVSNDSLSNSCNGVSGQPRGQSNCVILGKLITTNNGSELSTRSVIGTIPTGSLETDDLEALKRYNITFSPQTGENYTIDWGSSLNKTNGSDIDFSVLILRSPSSGIIRTFIKNARVLSNEDLKGMLNTSDLSNDVKVCVNSNGLFTGAKLAVYIGKNATSASGVEILGDDSGCY